MSITKTQKEELTEILENYFILRKESRVSNSRSYDSSKTIDRIIKVLKPRNIEKTSRDKNEKLDKKRTKESSEGETKAPKKKKTDEKVVKPEPPVRTGKWTLEEEDSFLKLMHGQTPRGFDWKKIGKNFFQNRAPNDVKAKFGALGEAGRYKVVDGIIKSDNGGELPPQEPPKKKWTDEEETSLIDLVVGQEVERLDFENLQKTHFPSKTVVSVRRKYHSFIREGLVNIVDGKVIKGVQQDSDADHSDSKSKAKETKKKDKTHQGPNV